MKLSLEVVEICFRVTWKRFRILLKVVAYQMGPG